MPARRNRRIPGVARSSGGALLLAAFILAGCTTGGRVGQNAPAFSAEDAQGETVSLAAYDGRTVILEFFAVW